MAIMIHRGSGIWSKASAAYATKILVAFLTKRHGSVMDAKGYSAGHVLQRGRAYSPISLSAHSVAESYVELI
jgi:hypothetical protein